MNIVIRADADIASGMGHLMRAIALARGLQKKGLKTTLFTYCEKDEMYRKAEERVDRTVRLNSTGTGDQMASFLKEEKVDWLVLDGYHFDAADHRAFREYGCRLMVCDDFAHLDHYGADIILNQNFGAERFSYNTEPFTKLLIGTDYVLLREEFTEYHARKKDIVDRAEKILITLGGVDKDNHTLKIVKAINRISRPLHLRIVLGAGNRHYRQIEKKAREGIHAGEIHQNVSNMATLMDWADIAITAGGTTLWELAVMGVPILPCFVVDNQEGAVTALSKEGFPSLGLITECSEDMIEESLTRLIEDRELRRSLSKKGKSIVDGKGIDRIVEAMSLN